MLRYIMSHFAALSPNQCYPYLPLPGKVDLLRMNGILKPRLRMLWYVWYVLSRPYRLCTSLWYAPP